MAEEPIRKEDILDFEGTLKGIRDLIDGFDSLNASLKKNLTSTVAGLTKEVQNYNAATKEGQINLKNASDVTEGFIVQQKALSKLDEDAIKLKAQLNALNLNEAKIVAELKVAIQAKTAALKADAQASNNVEGSVNDLTAKIKGLVEGYKALGPAAAKEAAAGIKKLQDQLDAANGAIGRHQGKVGDYTGTLKKLGTELLSTAGFVGGFATALKIGKEIIESTQSLSDKFAATLSGWAGGFSAIARAIANNDFKDFFQNVRDAIAEGQRYAETQVSINDSTRALKISIAEGETAILNLRNEQVKANKTDAERVEIGKKIQTILDSNAASRTKLAEAQLQNDIKDAAFIAKTSPELVEAYLRQDKATLETVDAGKKYNQLLVDLAGTTHTISTGTSSATVVDEKAAKAIQEKIDAMGPAATAYGALAKGLESITDKQKDQIVVDHESIETAKQSAINIRVTSKTAASAKQDEADAIEDANNKIRLSNMRMAESDKKAGDAIMNKYKNFDTSIFLKSIPTEKMSQRTKDITDEIGNIIDKSNAGLITREDRANRAKEGLYLADADAKKRIATDIASTLDSLAGKNKTLKTAALIAEKAVAIADIIIQTQKANVATRAWGAALGPVGMALAEGIVIKNKITEAFSIGAVIAATASGIAKMEHGGSGILEGHSHAHGGIDVGIGEAEGGEHIAITSRAMTNKYGGSMLDAVANSINQGKFFEVWANTNKSMGASDPYTKKMFELMQNTPTIYTDTTGDTVKEYPNGQKYIIKRLYKN